MTPDQAPQSRKALRGLIDLLEEVDQRYLGVRARTARYQEYLSVPNEPLG